MARDWNAKSSDGSDDAISEDASSKEFGGTKVSSEKTFGSSFFASTSDWNAKSSDRPHTGKSEDISSQTFPTLGFLSFVSSRNDSFEYPSGIFLASLSTSEK
eukprot:Pompholyxophrys_punicea_v1_NODE_16_length_6122_cov_13.926652.p2 type:complete len:102 gc:universal NODE_16_length_6122_cov_13.926652:495-190(-)